MREIIREVMHRGVVSCKVDARADQIARIMLDNDVSALVVIDEYIDACGVVTKTDLIGCYLPWVPGFCRWANLYPR